MTASELRDYYAGKIIHSDSEYDALMCEELVESIESNGRSGCYTDCYWMTVRLTNGDEFDVYVRDEEE